jgi:Flp pilus assembly protein TadD
LLERGLIAGRAIWFYASKLVWPADLVFIYPRWQVTPSSWWQYLYPAAAIAALAGLWTQRKRCPGLLVGALFFIGTLFPALGFFDVYPFLFSFVADHFQYLASLGLIALAAAGATALLHRWPAPRRRMGEAVCLAALLLLAARTWKQSHLYADRETLYRATLRGNPGCWMAHNNLAGVLIARGAANEAVDSARRALQIRPDYPEAHNNLALALGSLGQVDEAIPHYRKALELSPAYGEARNNLGFALAAKGRFHEAIAEYRQALQADPGRAGTHYNLAMALIGTGEMPAAMTHLRQAIALQPDLVQAHNNLGILLARSGRSREAVAEFRRALALEPDSAEIRRNLDLALGGRRRAESP